MKKNAAYLKSFKKKIRMAFTSLVNDKKQKKQKDIPKRNMPFVYFSEKPLK